MNLVVGQNFTAGALSSNATSSDLTGVPDFFGAPVQSVDPGTGQGNKATNQFAELLRAIERRAEPLDFSCSERIKVQLTEKADALILKMDAALQGIVTRVDVDNLFLLKLCVNALVAEGAESSGLKYACIAKNWCRRADFTDSVANGTALTETAEMFCRLSRYEDAARLFKSSAAAFSAILDFDHPLTSYSRKRHKMTLTKLALYGRNKYASTYGAGYLKAAESQNLCPLVWEGSTTL